jgi:hypothetical protein
VVTDHSRGTPSRGARGCAASSSRPGQNDGEASILSRETVSSSYGHPCWDTFRPSDICKQAKQRVDE